MFQHILRPVSIAAALLAATAAAHAGSISSADVKSTILIQEESGSSWWVLDVSPVVTVDPSTGGIALNTALMNQASVVTSVPGDKGQWSVSSTGGTTSLDWHSLSRNSATGAWTTSISLVYGGNVDPELSYSLRVKNSGTADKLVTFVQEGDIEPSVNGAFTVTNQIAGVLTNGTTAGNVKITPTQPDADGDLIQELQILELSNDGGATYVNAGVDVGAAANPSGAAGQLFTYGAYQDGKNSVGSFNYWRLTTKFKLSGNNDQAEISGTAEITPVPEAGSYAMLLAGVAAVAFVFRRRAA